MHSFVFQNKLHGDGSSLRVTGHQQSSGKLSFLMCGYAIQELVMSNLNVLRVSDATLQNTDPVRVLLDMTTQNLTLLNCEERAKCIDMMLGKSQMMKIKVYYVFLSKLTLYKAHSQFSSLFVHYSL